jgi:uncharacterized cupredoxin-like copper-binding protein
MRTRAGSRRHLRRCLGAASGTVVLAVGLVVALSPGATAAHGGRGSSSTVVVTLRDFRYSANVQSVPAGSVTFHIVNRGQSTHEFNVDRTDLADGSLPIRADGITVNEESSDLHRVDSVNTIEYHSTADLTVNLKRGHYVLYCNLEGHYQGGMHVSLTVR